VCLRGGVWKMGGLLWKQVGFQLFLFPSSCSISRNRDSDPTFKFHMEHDTLYIYRGILRTLFSYAPHTDSKQRLIPVAPKSVTHPPKLDILGIIR
jgi:hypothetical protein